MISRLFKLWDERSKLIKPGWEVEPENRGDYDKIQLELFFIEEKYDRLIMTAPLEWINVKDRLPDDGRGVLTTIFRKKVNEYFVKELHYNYVMGEWLDDDSENIENYEWQVTHWAELPEPFKYDI